MKISVSMICLNEVDYIAYALNSCSFADEIVIFDGGSEDGTIELLHKLRHDGLPIYTIMRGKWRNDFAAPRNEALLAVSKDADWWLRLDADETFPPLFRDNVRLALEIAPKTTIALRCRQSNLYPDPTHYAASHGGWETWPRIFRNIRHQDMTAFQWVGQVHEHVMIMGLDGLKDISEEQTTNWNAPVTHHGWLSDERRSEREELYMEIPGSGVEEPGDLRNRPYVVRLLPHQI